MDFTDAKIIEKGIYDITGIAFDSRMVEKGNMFFALKGSQQNGEKYAGGAIKNGASYVVVSETFDDFESDRLIYVDDVFESLRVAAKKYREKVNPVVIAVTGSVGKTSTKEFLHSVLSVNHNCMKTAGNLNTEVGISKCILEMPVNTEYAVLEHGVDYIGEMERQIYISQPNHAIITTIGSSHLEKFKTRAGIFKEKYSVCKEFTADSILAVNGDDDFLGGLDLEQDYTLLKIGEGSDAEYQIKKPLLSADKSSFVLNYDGRDLPFETALVGYHYISDAAYVAALCLKLGLDYQEVFQGLQKVEALKGRFEIIDYKGIKIINDAYNSSYESLIASSLSALEIANARSFAVFGDIREISDNPENSHREIGYKFNEIFLSTNLNNKNTKKHFDKIYFYGKMMRYVYEVYEGEKDYYNDMEQLVKVLKTELREEDLLLVKASRSINLDKVVDMLLED